MPATPTPPDISFPLESFPPEIAAWLNHTAAITRVPTSAIAAPFLAAAGATIGSQLAIQLAPGWLEPPTLWVAIVGPTGLGKTPALYAALAPFDTLHHRAWQTWRAACAATRRPFHRRDKLPPFNRLIVSGGPIAGLATALLDSTGLIVFRDELSGFIRALDRRAGEDRQAYLSLWSAEPLELLDDYCLRVPVVGIVGGLQPHRLQTIYRREPDGLLERFLLVFLTANIEPWRRDIHAEAPKPDPAPIVETLTSLRAIPDFDRASRPLIVPLDPDAASIWEVWYDANIEHISAASSTFAGFARKLPAHLARVALILHALWNPANPTLPVSGETMQRAIDLIECIRIHLQHTAALLDEPRQPRLRRASLEDRIVHVLDTDRNHWMGRQRLVVTLGRPATADFNSVIADLLHRNLLETRRQTGLGRTATEYRLRPLDLPAENSPP